MTESGDTRPTGTRERGRAELPTPQSFICRSSKTTIPPSMSPASSTATRSISRSMVRFSAYATLASIPQSETNPTMTRPQTPTGSSSRAR